MNLFAIAGWLLICMVLLSFGHIAFPALPFWLSGLCAWLVLVILIAISLKAQFKQFFALGSAGMICLIWGMARGASLPWESLLSQNISLLVMLFSVSFLRLVAFPRAAQPKLLTGKAAFLTTFLWIQGLGAIINLSILTLVGERFRAQQVLGRENIMIMGRAFSLASFWSPFFAAMGVALTYAPGVNLAQLMIYGIGVAILAFLVSLWELVGIRMQKAHHFHGYPMQWSSLAIPVSLALAVILLHYYFPQVPILALVSMMALVLSMGVLCMREGKQAITPITEHIQGAAKRMVREIALFLGAALMSIGIQVLMSTYPHWQLLQTFGALEASLLLAAAIAVAMVGIHPVISISLISAMVMPLQPPPVVLALLFLSTWSLGVLASPLSGMNVMLFSQFEVRGRDLFYWHIRYVVMMWGILSCIFALMFAVLN